MVNIKDLEKALPVDGNVFISFNSFEVWIDWEFKLKDGQTYAHRVSFHARNFPSSEIDFVSHINRAQSEMKSAYEGFSHGN